MNLNHLLSPTITSRSAKCLLAVCVALPAVGCQSLWTDGNRHDLAQATMMRRDALASAGFKITDTQPSYGVVTARRGDGAQLSPTVVTVSDRPFYFKTADFKRIKPGCVNSYTTAYLGRR